MRHGSNASDRKMATRAILVIAVAAAVLTAGFVLWGLAHPALDTGSRIIPQGTMTDEQSQTMLDAQARRSRITISLQPEPKLADGKLRINFLVPESNSGFAERLELEQDGKVFYRSGVVEPGSVIEWCDAPKAHGGPAIATVYAVEGEGSDSGNPVSVEVDIRDEDSEVSAASADAENAEEAEVSDDV